VTTELDSLLLKASTIIAHYRDGTVSKEDADRMAEHWLKRYARLTEEKESPNDARD
jgi:hypothetical protein